MNEENMQRRREMASLFSAVFGSAEGAKVLREIAGFCGARSEAFSAASERQTSYNLGRQSVARWIAQLVEERPQG